ETLADLLDRLGSIPPERVRFRPPPGTATESDVLAALEAPRKRLCELIDGVLVEKPRGYTESVLALFLAEALNAFVRAGNLGLVTDPAARAAGAYTAPDAVTVLTETDTLTGDPVLPGFQLALHELFAELDRRG